MCQLLKQVILFMLNTCLPYRSLDRWHVLLQDCPCGWTVNPGHQSLLVSSSGRPLFTKVVTAVDCFRNSWILLTSLGESCGKFVLLGFVLLGFTSHTLLFADFILNLLAMCVIIFWITLDSFAGFLYVSTLAHDYSASVMESRFWWTAGVLDTLGSRCAWETEG